MLLPVALVSCTSSRPPTEDSTAVVSGELGSLLNRYAAAAADSGFSGVVLVTARGDTVLHRAYGWADRSRETPLELTSRFWIGSLSKQFTAAAILTLVQDERLGVGDSIGQFLSQPGNEKQAITVHQLLAHTSGLGHNYAADGIGDRNSAAQAILSRPLNGVPGDRFRYSNDGYSLLAMIVEIASERSFESYVTDRLLQAAELRDTGLWGSTAQASVVGTTAKTPVLARVFGSLSNRNVRRPNWGYRGASGMYSTAGDLHRWQDQVLDGTLLTPEAKEKMLTAHISVGEKGGYGYGWFLSTSEHGAPVIQHGGNEDWLGHSGALRIYPEEEITVIVLSNAGEVGSASWSRRVADAFEQIVFPSRNLL
jgi:CubicO group peptidase (beta-lactamase class C family)